MNAPVLYMNTAAWTDTLCVLTGAQAAHAHVLRLRAGDAAELFDGCGRSARCRVVAIDKRAVHLKIETTQQAPVPTSRAIIALALSKAVRRGFFMEKAAELHAHEIWLWQADHSQGTLPADAKDSWQGQLIAGLKQCRNPWLPVLRLLGDAAGLIACAAHTTYKLLPWELPAGQAVLTPAQVGRPGDTVYVIGPEGGFSRREIDLFIHADFVPVSLGQGVLRCETAALLCLGLHFWAAHLPEAP